MAERAGVFGIDRALIGMVHTGALPGTPHHEPGASADQLIELAVADAKTLIAAGFDGVIVENMHDRPYVHGRQDAAITAHMTLAAKAVADAIGDEALLGIQILSGGNHEAIAIQQALGMPNVFIRCENFVFSHVADEGLLERAEAGLLLRYRRQIGADSVRVFADIKKKHASHAITADLSVAEAARAALFFSADGLIVTGTATGQPTDPADLAAARSVIDSESRAVPLLVGSGVTPDNLPAMFEHADGVIVGSAVKVGGHWAQPVDPNRCEALVRARGR